MLAMLGLCPSPLQGASSRTRSKLSGGKGGPGARSETEVIHKYTKSWCYSLININRRNLNKVSLGTFGFLCRVAAHSLSAVKAGSFD